jgi:hypothetical protein
VLGTTTHAEALHQNDKWVKHLSAGASIQILTWGVVIHDVPGKACKLPDNMDGIIN